MADARAIDPDGIAAIFPTGGTTGEPKGVTFKYRTLSKIAYMMKLTLEARGDLKPVFLASAPLTHVAGRVCLGVMVAGGETVILPKFDASAVLRAIPKYKVSLMAAPPTMLTLLMDEPDVREFDYSSLNRVGVGAAPVSVELLKRALDVFGSSIQQSYSQTEAPMFVTSKIAGDDFIDGKLATDGRLKSCGRPTEFCELRILDPDGIQIGPGHVGEIVVRGEFVMDGYDGDPDATAASQVDGFHRTGDLGFVDEDGFLTITGRAKDMIITGGFNVYPAEVENVLAELPEIRESAVLGLPDETWGELVVAVVEVARGAILDPQAVLDFGRERLGGVKAPKRILVIDELPRNQNGKIPKSALLDRLISDREVH